MPQKPHICNYCPANDFTHSFASPEGKGKYPLVLVGEALGKEEAIDGLPFRPRAQAGSLLEFVFKLSGVKREDVVVDNILHCKPPGNELVGQKWEREGIDYCTRQFLYPLLASPNPLTHIVPTVVLALGNTPFRELVGNGFGVSGHNSKKTNTFCRGYVFKADKLPLYIVPTYHPSFVRRGNMKLTSCLKFDLKKALAISTGKFTQFSEHGSYREPDYITHPGLDDIMGFINKVKDNINLPLAYDIETPDTNDVDEEERGGLENNNNDITLVQFSLAKNTGLAIPFNHDNIDYIRSIFGCGNIKLGFNSRNFDNPKLGLNGIEIEGRKEGKCHDLMNMWGHYQPDLPKNLQFVTSFFHFPRAWKHLAGSMLEFYGCSDVDALHYIYEGLPEIMRRLGIWGGYESKVHGLTPSLDNMQERGIPVDRESREELKIELTRELEIIDKEINKEIPEEILNIHPKGGYKRTPVEIYNLEMRYFSPGAIKVREEIESKGGEVIGFVDYVNKMLRKEGGEDIWDLREFEVERVERDDMDGYNIKVKRWCKIIPFKPNSSKQTIAYIRYKQSQDIKRGIKSTRSLYQVPLTLGDKKKTTEKDEIERLAISTGDKVFKGILSHRRTKKMLTTDIPQWEPDGEGLVHPTFTFQSATGQLTSRNPNAQNIPKHADLAKKFRRMFKGGEESRIVELDMSSFHAVTLAREAKCKEYMFLAKRDVHSFLASYLVNQPIDYDLVLRAVRGNSSADGELKEKLKFIKRKYKHIRDTKAKPSILGIGFGLGPTKLHHMNRESFNGPRDAKYVIDLIFNLFPRLKEYQGEICKIAAKQTYLISNWGFIRWFYDVMRFDWVSKEWVKGEGAEKAIAFLPANDAHGMMRKIIIECERKGYNERFRFINCVHDSLVFNPNRMDVDSCIEMVIQEMIRPCEELKGEICEGGLRVGVEVGVGRDWEGLEMVRKMEND